MNVLDAWEGVTSVLDTDRWCDSLVWTELAGVPGRTGTVLLEGCTLCSV
jgi:hypothetical protein